VSSAASPPRWVLWGPSPSGQRVPGLGMDGLGPEERERMPGWEEREARRLAGGGGAAGRPPAAAGRAAHPPWIGPARAGGAEGEGGAGRG
jgi:hypothetical protein